VKHGDLKKAVRESYADIARKECSCCCGGDAAEGISKSIGYTDEDMNAAPEGANLGLGCGNPVALASLNAGETVLDLGSGAGIDCFLAADRVGADGKVIGVDMTPEMIEKAKANAEKGGYGNVEFRLGDIEDLPVEDGEVNVIISNCVINLSPDKPKVFQEALRALAPGGRLMVSDLVLLKELPDAIRDSAEAYVSCIAGAWMKDDYLKAIEDAGFEDVRIDKETIYPLHCLASDPAAGTALASLDLKDEELAELASSIAAISVSAVKPVPGARCC
jgi:SAM-dependent methyltransferase